MGVLFWISLRTRPDIAWAVGRIARLATSDEQSRRFTFPRLRSGDWTFPNTSAWSTPFLSSRYWLNRPDASLTWGTSRRATAQGWLTHDNMSMEPLRQWFCNGADTLLRQSMRLLFRGLKTILQTLETWMTTSGKRGRMVSPLKALSIRPLRSLWSREERLWLTLRESWWFTFRGTRGQQLFTLIPWASCREARYQSPMTCQPRFPNHCRRIHLGAGSSRGDVHTDHCEPHRQGTVKMSKSLSRRKWTTRG